MLGQVAYHLLAAAHSTRAPWPVVVLVSCLPVVTFGFGAALTHLLHIPVGHVQGNETEPGQEPEVVCVTESKPELQQASAVLSLVAGDAESAAEAAMRATFAASNPLSVNQLSTRFNLIRQAATRVRDRVLAEANGHHSAELPGDAASEVAC